MISLRAALAHYADIASMATETVATTAALGRVLAQAPQATIDLPRIDQSAMDGYAVQTALAQAGKRLPVIGIAAPGTAAEPLQAASAMRIYTGAAVPSGADAVIPQERVRRDGEQIEIQQASEVGANIRRRAEELRRGASIGDVGSRITPGLLAALAMAGIDEIEVHRLPCVSILITGDEVRPPGTPLAAEQVPDANAPLITACLQSWGIPPITPEYVPDDRDAVVDATARALESSDLVLTTGGASVGDRDFIPGVAQELGVEKRFWKVAQKPGKPLFFGRRGATALLGLPGNPGAVLVGMIVHARRILECLSGVAKRAPHWYPGTLAQAQNLDHGRDCLLRMQLQYAENGQVLLHALPRQASHMLSNLAAANVLVWMPAGESQAPSGTQVMWTPLPDTEVTG